MKQEIYYFNRDGKRISEEQFEDELKSFNLSKPMFDNGKVFVSLQYIGKVPNANDIIPECREVIKSVVQNYFEGRLINDPVENDIGFPNLASAKQWYEDFLLDWTESETIKVKNAKGQIEERLVEKGNKYKPEVTPIPSTEYDDDDCGAW